MALPALLIPLLWLQVLAQPPSITNPTLLQSLTAATPPNSLEGRAFLAIYESHPELENFHVDSLTVSNTSSPNSTCFIVHLARYPQTAVVEVSISADRRVFSVNFIAPPIALLSQKQTGLALPARKPDLPGKERNTSLGITVLSSNLTVGHSSGSAPGGDDTIPLRAEYNGSLPKLGGFSPFTRYTDPRFKLALDYLTDLHPNIINYEIAEVQYQVVVGLNFLIRYVGLDKFTAVVTKVNVDLKMKANLLHFNVYCQEAGVECEHAQAERVYMGVETVIRKHEELMDYDLISLVVEESNSTNLLFLTSFEHTEMSLRAISHVKMVDRNEITLSFFTYHYPA